MGVGDWLEFELAYGPAVLVVMLNPTTPTGNDSPFAQAYEQLGALGFHVIPCLPRDKAPGERSNGRWRALTAWPQFRDRAPTVFEITAWKSWAEANIGVVVGTAIGPHRLLVVDIDSHDPDEVSEIRSAIPASPMIKTGAKGCSLFFRAPATLTSKGYNIKGKRVVDLLASGRQTVMPPSVHPHGPTYRWLAGPVPAHELPLFDETCLERLEDTLAHLGWGGDVVEQARVSRKPLDRHDDDPSVWQEVNEAAMANMPAWVPALDLYGLRPVQRGGYEAVATWRPSGSGERLEKRKRNLKIYPDGIRDFGADVGYSPLDLVCAANNWALDDAFRWLKDRLELSSEPVFVVHETPSGASQAPLSITDEPQPVQIPAKIKHVAPTCIDSDELPHHLLQVPGLVGDIAHWITASSRKPQPGLALGAALTLIGTAAGRKFAGPTRSGTHLYVLALAPTGAGKNHPLDQINRVLSLVMTREQGPSQFMSYSSVIKRLERHPLVLCAMDEFGSFLAKINNRKSSSSHEQAISGVLRTAWGCSFSTMTTPEYANEPSKVIHSPALSIYGASTQEEFYRSLQGSDVHNGFLNRFLILSTRHRPAECDPSVDAYTLPEPIKLALDRVFYAGNALANMTAHNVSADAPSHVVPWGPGAQDVYRALGRLIESREADESFLARTSEMAVRLATIRAIGIDQDAPVVQAADMAWARDLALWSAERMIAESSQFMSENDKQAEHQMVLRLIEQGGVEGGGKISQGELSRKIRGRLDTNRVKSILAGLVESEQVLEEKMETPGRIKRLYVLAP